MPKTDELFELIKSLSKSEKRYFKIHSEKHVLGDGNNYIKLFEAMDKQIIYDEKKILRQFSTDQFSKRLAVVKSYLHRLILKSLAAFHSGSSIDIELNEQLTYIELLYNKLLYKQCLKLISKAKKKAYEHDEINHLLNLIWWERTVYNDLSFSGKTRDEMKSMYEEEKFLIKKLQNSRDMEALFSDFYYVYTHEGTARNEEEIKTYKEMINHPLLKNENRALSFNARNKFYSAHSFCYRAINDPEKQYKYDKKRVELIEANPKFIKEYIHTYMGALQNLMISTVALKKEDEFFASWNKYRSLDVKAEVLKIKIFGFSNNILLVNYAAKGDFSSALVLIKEFENGLDSYGDKVDKQSQLIFNYNIAYAYLILGEYSLSLSRINKVIHFSDSNLRYEIQSMARVMSLILHFELKNPYLLESMAKSTYRFLSKRNKLYKMEISLLNYIRKLSNLKSKEDIMNSFKILKKELEEIAKNDLEKSMLPELDVISWLDSKINKVSFEHAYRANMRLGEKVDSKAQT